MTMPKGHKSPHGYATVKSLPGGMDYRSIAEKMTVEGDKMNHATARNVFLCAMKKFAGRDFKPFDVHANNVMMRPKTNDIVIGKRKHKHKKLPIMI